MDDKWNIKLRAQELCRQIQPANQYNILDRNERIIQQLMKEFNVDRELVEKCFYHNKEF